MQRRQARTKKGKGKKTRKAYSPSPLRERRSAARVGPIASADETDVRLKYVYNSYATNALSGVVSKEWTPNAAYDVDPSFGSTATNAFDAYALLYSYYRVTGYRYKLEVINQEADPVVAYCYNTNTSVSGSSLDVYAGSPYCSTAMLGPKTSGTNRHTFSGTVQCSKLLGSIEAETDATMRSVVTSVPSDLLFLTLFAQSTGTVGTLTNGIVYIISITMNVRFYGRVYNASNSLEATQQRVNELQAARQELQLKKKLQAAKTARSPPVCQ